MWVRCLIQNLPLRFFIPLAQRQHRRWVVLSHRAILANAEALKTERRLTDSSVHYCILPLYHINAFSFSFLRNLAARSQLVLSNRFRAQHFWETVVAESCQTCNGVPEVVSQLITKADPNPHRLHQARRCMRYFVSAASTLSRDWYTWGKYRDFHRTKIIDLKTGVDIV